MKTAAKLQSSGDMALVDALLQKPVGPCVSIVVRQVQQANMQKQNLNKLHKEIKRAKAALDAYRTTEKMRASISEKLDKLIGSLVPETEQGIGVFVSDEASGVIKFPFEVNEITLVADSFETRDLWYLKEYMRPYFVVVLAKKGARFFRGISGSLEEIRNGVFPVDYEDDYEYERASLGTSYGYAMKGFEKDKGVVRDQRLNAQVKTSARHVASLLKDPWDELLIAGPEKLCRDFVSSFPVPRKILGTVKRTINTRDFNTSSQLIWETVQLRRKDRTESLVAELEDLGLNFKASGIRDVWSAARNGKGRVLLVERGLRKKAYLPRGAEEIRLHPPRGQHSFIADAVDDVIEKVKTKGGEVVFAESGQLRKFENIALLFRY